MFPGKNIVAHDSVNELRKVITYPPAQSVYEGNVKYYLHSSKLGKGYLRYKMITSQNVSSEAQVKNFFIS